MFAKASTLSALVAFFAAVDQTAALGINCRGSGLCPRASWDNQGAGSVLQGLRDAMYSAKIDENTKYAAGDHIICVSQSQKVTISPSVNAGITSGGGAEGGATGTVGAGVSVGLTGSIGNGGVCVFPQKTDMTLKQARTLIDGLLEHKCSTCGSNPSSPGNNVDNGELTVNYVAAPYCIKNCLSAVATGGAAGSTNPTAGQSKRDNEDDDEEEVEEVEDDEETELTPRWGKRGERLRLE